MRRHVDGMRARIAEECGLAYNFHPIGHPEGRAEVARVFLAMNPMGRSRCSSTAKARAASR